MTITTGSTKKGKFYYCRHYSSYSKPFIAAILAGLNTLCRTGIWSTVVEVLAQGIDAACMLACTQVCHMCAT